MQHPPDPRQAALEQENAGLRRELAALQLKLDRLSASAGGAGEALEATASLQIDRLISERDQLVTDYQNLLDQLVLARQNVHDLFQRRLKDYARTLTKIEGLEHTLGQFRPVANILLWIGTLVAHEAQRDRAHFDHQLETLLAKKMPAELAQPTGHEKTLTRWQHHPQVYTANTLADIVFMERMSSRLVIAVALMELAIDTQLDIGVLLDTLLIACEQGRDPDLRTLNYLCQYWPEVPAKRPATLYKALKETQQRPGSRPPDRGRVSRPAPKAVISPAGHSPKRPSTNTKPSAANWNRPATGCCTDWKSAFSPPDDR